MKILINCSSCGKKFEKDKSEYNRRLKNGNKNFYCSKICNVLSVSSKNKKNHSVIRECLWCGNAFTSSTHKRYKKCCSVDCAVKYAQSHVDTNNISETLKKKYLKGELVLPDGKGGFKSIHTKIKKSGLKLKCVICKTEFSHDINKKTCSKKCRNLLMSNITREHPNCGGETNYKKYFYNGICMDSSWEVELAKWLDDQKISWERDKEKHNFKWTDINSKVRRYYPDFYLPDYKMYLDPKNKYLLKVDDFKLKQVIKENNINLVYGDVESIKIKVLEESKVINLVL